MIEQLHRLLQAEVWYSPRQDQPPLIPDQMRLPTPVLHRDPTHPLPPLRPPDLAQQPQPRPLLQLATLLINTNASSSNREVTTIDLTDKTSTPADNSWEGYRGALADVRGSAIATSTLRIPTPQARRGGWNRRSGQQEWRPTMSAAPKTSTSSRPWRSSQTPPWRRTRTRNGWVQTGIYRSTDQAWNDLWRQYPYVEGEDDFYYDASTGEWFVREWF